MLYGYIQVAMGSCLLAEQGIDTPTPVDADIDSVLIEKLSYLDHVTRGHFRFVFWQRGPFDI